MNGELYRRYAVGRARKSPLLVDCIKAFGVGGLICTAAEALTQLYTTLGMTKDNAGTVTSVTLIALTALCTGLGVFDRLAKHAGGGTLVPITGFANAVSSAAIDAKTDERDIIGLSRKAS